MVAMKTLTVDDRELLVNYVVSMLRNIDPEGTHIGESSAEKAISICEEYKPDVAFLDVEMPEMTGIDLAKRLIDECPGVHIIFITGHKEYAFDAFQIHASGYLLKPVSEEAIKENLDYISTLINRGDKRIEIRCFGSFEVYIDGKPVKFARTKTKELFAFLVDRNGAMCSIDMMCGNLYPDKPLSASSKSSLRNLIFDLKKTLVSYGYDDVILKNRGLLGIDKEKVDCDYYRYLSGEEEAISRFTGEYMTQYDFAEETRANLMRRFFIE